MFVGLDEVAAVGEVVVGLEEEVEEEDEEDEEDEDDVVVV